MPITIEVVDPTRDHIIIRSDEPCRIELSVVELFTREGAALVHAYRGAETDPDQEPDAVYDGTVPSPPCQPFSVAGQRPDPLPKGVIQAEARDE